MAETIKDFFTIEIIYQFVNIGVVPFWLMLIFLPASKFTNLLVNNLFMPTVLALTYGYIVYQQIYPLEYMMLLYTKDFLCVTLV